VDRTSLWLGKDHLLCLSTNGYTETYKRFFFRDIQAFTIVLTQRRQAWNWVLGLALAWCAAGCAYSLFSGGSITPGWLGVGFAVTLSFAGLLVLNNLLGPTCVCQLRSAVQTEVLSSVRRLKRARKLLARLEPLIAGAQAPGGVGAGAIDIGTPRTSSLPSAAGGEPPIIGAPEPSSLEGTPPEGPAPTQ
jgi:hypothetical protein